MARGERQARPPIRNPGWSITVVERAAKIRVNYPDPLQGQLGPFISLRQADIVDAHLDDALAKGARLVAGGKSQILGGGRYMHPTVLTNVNHSMVIMRELGIVDVMTADSHFQQVNLGFRSVPE